MFRSSTLCLGIAIAILVQVKIFECAEECTCRCNNQYVCHEMGTLKTNQDANKAQWETWKRYLDRLRILYDEFDHETTNDKLKSVENRTTILEKKINGASVEISRKEFEVLIDKIGSVENKIQSIEGLKGRLRDAESRAELLENQLENVKRNFEEKMDEFEKKLQNQAIEAEKKFTMTQNDISNVEEKVLSVEDWTKRYEPTIEAEKEARKQMQEQLLQNISRMYSETENKHEELKNDLQADMLDVKNETKILKSDIEEEKKTRIRFERELLQNVSQEFPEAQKQQNKLKNDLQAEIRKVADQVAEERKFRTSYQNRLLQDLPNKFNEAEKERKKVTNDLAAKIRNVESDVEDEIRSMSRSEGRVLNLSSRISALTPAFDKVQADLGKLQSIVQQIHPARYRRLGRRDLESVLSEIRKNPSSADSKATPLETVI